MTIPYRAWTNANCQFLAAHGDDDNGNNWNVFTEWDDSNLAPTLKVGQKKISATAYDVWTVNVRPDGALVSGADIGVYAKIDITTTLDTNDPTLTTFRLMRGPTDHTGKWDTGDGTGRFYDGINQWSSYPIYDLSVYSANDYCDSPADVTVASLPKTYTAYIPALDGSNRIIFGGDPDVLGGSYPCQDELFKNGYWIKTSYHVDAGGNHPAVDWNNGEEFSLALSAFTVNVYFFNPVVNSVNVSKVSEAGGDTLILTGMGFDNSDADIEKGGVGAGSSRAGGWVDDVYEIDLIGNEGQGTTVIKEADGDFTVDSNTQITITTPALSAGTYNLLLWKDRDGSRHETAVAVSAYAGDWAAAAGGAMTVGTRIVLTVGAVSEISYRWRYIDSSDVFKSLWRLSSTTSIVSGNIILKNLQTSNKVWTARMYDDAFVLHTQVEIEDKIRFLDGVGGYAGFQSGFYTSNVDYTWPVADGSSSQALCTDGSGVLSWRSKGDTTGPSSSTDNAIVRFDGASGKIIQNSVCLLDDSGLMLLNETANANMTVGITAQQGDNDNEIYAGKSTDVAHGFTTYTETDTFFHVNKASADGGGALIDALSDADIDAVNVPTFQIRGVTKDSGYTAAGLAAVSVVQVQGLYGSGTTRSAAPSGMNVWSVRTYDNAGSWQTLWIIKESGNANLKGTLSAPDLDLSAPSSVYGLSHDSFADFVADEHIAHSGVTLTAGTGLTGGGTIAANRTFNVDVGIADDKIVQIDHAAAADDDYAKFTASGLEGRSYSETLGDIGGASKTTAAWSKSIGSGGDYATWAAMIADMPDLIAHAVTVTIKTGTTLTEICNLKNKHGLTVDAAIMIQAEDYFPQAGAIPTATGATATTLVDAGQAWDVDRFIDCWVFVVDGTGTDNGYVKITDSDATSVTVAAWPGVQPDNTSRYIIVGALIDGEATRGGVALSCCTASVSLYGIGIDDTTTSLYSGNCFRVYMAYCGHYHADYGCYILTSKYVYIRYNGIVDNSTAGSSEYGGVTARGTNTLYLRDCGVSDNDLYGVHLRYGAFGDVYNNFGDGNGNWGTWADYSGQARCWGAECSGAAGNHSDPGTAGNANADQAAAY